MEHKTKGGIFMNHQELFKPDVNFPRFFSSWPYFILIVAALLTGSRKVSSQGLFQQENQWPLTQRVIASSHPGTPSEPEKKNRCDSKPTLTEPTEAVCKIGM
jgi:hypothetical protein